MNEDCLFCKIAQGLIPSDKVFENERVLAFKDINPIAKVHILFIHKEHTPDVNQMMDANPKHLTDIFQAVKEYTRREALDIEGFRILSNLGKHAGQTIFHTHFHLLGGEPLKLF